MYALKANFYEAQQGKNGYIGKADITIGNTIKINNISVFVNDGKTNLAFAKFGKNNEHSYIIPASKEAYAAMVAVVENAIANENHFGYTKGDYGVRLEVNGERVNEHLLDGRFSIKVGDFCTLNGITTFSMPSKSGGSMVFVRFCSVEDADGKQMLYYDKDGKEHSYKQFVGVRTKFTNKEGKEVSIDYNEVIVSLVEKCHGELGQSLDNTIVATKAKQMQRETDKVAPRYVKYALQANFYKAQQGKNGYIGNVDIIIARAVMLRDISVFVNDGKINLAFAKFGKDNEHSYVIPASKEAYADMVAVVEKAIADEEHCASTLGDYDVRLEVNGVRANEPYCDGRFSIKVGDFCTLNGTTTFLMRKYPNYYVDVDYPQFYLFMGDCRDRFYSMVKECRGELYQSLDNTIAAAKAKQMQRGTDKAAPSKGQEPEI